jgi:septum formation protein
METIVLASSSARRREICDDLCLPYIGRDPDIDESRWEALPPPERVLALAEAKARAVAERLDSGDPRLILGADTLVCLSSPSGAEIVMGKPRDRAEASSMIESLAGKEHFVHTGIALVDRRSDRTRRARSDSRVRFAAMTKAEIDRYLDSGDWDGAAGAYKIQGEAALFIEHIEGSWSGIVGLPLRELYVILCDAGCRLSDDRKA